MELTTGVVVHLLVELVLVIRVMLKPHRDPASRIAWIAVIGFVPFLGILGYLLFGETNIGRRRSERLRQVLADMPEAPPIDASEETNLSPSIPSKYQPLFRLGESISGFKPVGGNSATLMKDSNTTIDSMVADIDAATEHVHLLFYIWLADNNGTKIVEALKRAASRGVVCRAMVDNLGSRAMIRSEHWQSMQDAGVRLAIALPIGNPFLRTLIGRIDLRNHRKTLVIDGHTTYCGSQNCADPEFLVKAKYAPWVDAVMRFEGPIARQNLQLFASDWMTYTDDSMHDLLREPLVAPEPGIPAQVIGTGPTSRYSAMSETFEALCYSAQKELVISTPYYIPNDSIQNAICSAAYRGVKTTMIFPARNDSWVVAGASRSYYAELLEAGVVIHEYQGGLLHTKSLTLDGEVTLIGSANMDRRSFELNYENNILLCDSQLTEAMRERQQSYINQSQLISLDSVISWTYSRRLWNNTLAVLGPIL
ncbi:cardiolipin synthase [Thalassoroseus pseudoceratinae]|uniref:cardiolipin synthase n=1 Tax=Thalassoroseus pseudoceratinae TaxID=2713176 RepID=UPI0014237AE5|nr:cardiolipin synthase [Thalassoroseus pseudoceratinae]